jgi:hypothetical protein
MSYNILQDVDINKLKVDYPERFRCELVGGEYINLQGLDLVSLEM